MVWTDMLWVVSRLQARNPGHAFDWTEDHPQEIHVDSTGYVWIPYELMSGEVHGKHPFTLMEKMDLLFRIVHHVEHTMALKGIVA